MKLMSVSINTRVNGDAGFTIFAMYQERGLDGRYGEPLYNWIDTKTWEEVLSWITSNPIGSPIKKS